MLFYIVHHICVLILLLVDCDTELYEVAADKMMMMMMIWKMMWPNHFLSSTACVEELLLPSTATASFLFLFNWPIFPEISLGRVSKVSQRNRWNC